MHLVHAFIQSNLQKVYHQASAQLKTNLECILVTLNLQEIFVLFVWNRIIWDFPLDQQCLFKSVSLKAWK